MATEVYTTETIRLLDETEVELRPLPISKLRKFTRIWAEHIKGVRAKLQAAVDSDDENAAEEFGEADLTDEQYDVFIKLCAFGLEGQLKDGKTDKQFAAYLEDVLDEATIYRILNVTGGLKLGDEDPNSQNPAAVATALAAAGTN